MSPWFIYPDERYKFLFNLSVCPTLTCYNFVIPLLHSIKMSRLLGVNLCSYIHSKRNSSKNCGYRDMATGYTARDSLLLDVSTQARITDITLPSLIKIKKKTEKTHYVVFLQPCSGCHHIQNLVHSPQMFLIVCKGEIYPHFLQIS